MSTKSTSEFSLKLTGPGISFDRKVTEEIATRVINLALTGADGSTSRPTGDSGNTGATTPINDPQTGQNIKQFIKAKQPQNDYQRVACLAYYLANNMDTAHFKTLNISKANIDAAGPKLSNPSQTINDATRKYHFFSTVGGGKKQLTTLGDEIVEALPDQEKVKQIIAQNKKSTRKKTKKK